MSAASASRGIKGEMTKFYPGSGTIWDTKSNLWEGFMDGFKDAFNKWL